jgi:hypothetical protein
LVLSARSQPARRIVAGTRASALEPEAKRKHWTPPQAAPLERPCHHPGGHAPQHLLASTPTTLHSLPLE